MKRTLILSAALVLVAACSGGPTGVDDPAPMNPDAIFSYDLGPDVTQVIDNITLPDAACMVGEAWDTQLEENLYDKADRIAARVAEWNPDLIEIRQSRIIPVIGEPSGRDLPQTGACVDFGELLHKTLAASGLNYDFGGRCVEVDLDVSMSIDGYPVLPMRLVVCRTELTRYVIDYPPPL